LSFFAFVRPKARELNQSQLHSPLASVISFGVMKTPISIAMYQPDIPQNMGAMMRLCACMDVSLEIIEPCGFPWNDKKISKSGMD